GLLVNFSGEKRRSNLFALPTSLAEGNWVNITNMFSGLDNGSWSALKVGQSHGKYSVLNICPLSKLGSVEIRCMRGTTDVAILKDWISMIHSILTFSKTDITPREVVHMYRELGVSFGRKIFGETLW